MAFWEKPRSVLANLSRGPRLCVFACYLVLLLVMLDHLAGPDLRGGPLPSWTFIPWFGQGILVKLAIVIGGAAISARFGHVFLRSYSVRWCRTLWRVGPIDHHYLSAIPICFFLLWFRYLASLQEAFFFSGDYFVSWCASGFMGALVSGRRSQGAPSGSWENEAPIEEWGEDQMQLRHLVDQMVAIVVDRKPESASMSVGLLGAWGSGKTSALNLFKRELSEHPKLKHLPHEVVTLNAAEFSDLSLLYEHYFKRIHEAARRRILVPLLKQTEVQNTIAELVGEVRLGGLLRWLAGPREENLPEYFSTLLKTARITVVVLIDDLDRIPTNEMDGLFKLLRLSHSTRGIVNFIAADPARLQMYARAFNGSDQ